MASTATDVQQLTDLPLLEHIALGLLLREPRHGYALFADFVEVFEPVYQAGRSKFYARLNDLEAAGYLTSQMEPQDNRPPRKVYGITAEGEAAFRQWLATPVTAPRHIRVVLPVKLRFYAMHNLAGASSLLDAQIIVLKERQDREAKRTDEVAADGDELFAELLAAFRQRQLTAMLEWLIWCKERFSS